MQNTKKLNKRECMYRVIFTVILLPKIRAPLFLEAITYEKEREKSNFFKDYLDNKILNLKKKGVERK